MLLYYKKLVFCICWIFISVYGIAQEIKFSLPSYAESSYVFSTYRGLHTDTIFSGKLDDGGNANIILPETYSNYKGLCSLRLENGITLELIVNNENFSVFSSSEVPSSENVTFNGSAENTFIIQMHQQQQSSQLKSELLYNLLSQYQKDDPFFSELNKEIEKTEKEISLLESRIKQSSLYAARFLEWNELINNLYNYTLLEPEKQSYILNYTIHELNYEDVFNSSLWRYLLTGWSNCYEGSSLDIQDNFTKDALSVFTGIDNPDIRTEYANDLVSICEAKGWDDAKIKIAFGVYQSGLLAEPTGNIGRLIRNMGLFTHQKAQDIDLGDGLMMSTLNSPYYLIIFYESGCENCDVQIQQIRRNQKLIEEKGYTIVSVSADMDEDIDRGTRDFVGWKYKLCDYRGYDGILFENYGILGTPTIFILDKELNILGQFTSLEQTGIIK